MKKFFRFVFVTLVTIVSMYNVSFGQVWKSTYHEADELKDEDAYYSNLFVDNKGDAFVSWSNTNDVKVVSNRGIFDYDRYNFVKGIVGFYENGQLMEKVSVNFYVPKGDANNAYTSDIIDKTIGKKIITHLKTKGNVRIILSKYSGADFDLMIPMNKDIK